MRKLWILLLLVVGCAKSTSTVDVFIHQKTYVPASSSSGTVINSDGSVGIMTSETPERYKVLVTVEGTTFTDSVSPDTYVTLVEGTTVRATIHKSWVGLTIDWNSRR